MATPLGGPQRLGLPPGWLSVCAERPVPLQPRKTACVQGGPHRHPGSVWASLTSHRQACHVRLDCVCGHAGANLPWLHGSAAEACHCLYRSAHALALLRDQSSLSRYSSAIEQPHLLALSSLSREPSRQVSPAVQRGAAAGQDQGAALAEAEEAGAQPAAGGHLVSLDDVWVKILTQEGTPQVPLLPGIIKWCMRTCS